MIFVNSNLEAAVSVSECIKVDLKLFPIPTIPVIGPSPPFKMDSPYLPKR
jgi:hypothetical protein